MKKKQNILSLKKNTKLSIVFSCLLSLFIQTASFAQSSNPFLMDNNQSKSPSLDKRTILIVLDASASMEDKLYGETKIHIAKRVLEDVLTKANTNINLGLRIYGASKPTGNQSLDCSDSKLVVLPGTNNRRTIISETNKILPRGFTPITYSLSEAVQDISPYNGEKSIILISDGLETCGGDPCQLSKSFINAGIDLKVDVVGFGVKDDWLAQEQLMCIALSTNGKYYSANSPEQLTQGLSTSINESVTGRIITMIGKPIEVQTEETQGYENLPVLQAEPLNVKKKKNSN